MTITTRKYQERDKKNIKKSFEKFRSVLFQCPTGGGKSVVAADLVDEWIEQGARILVMAHRRELLQQFDGHFSGRDIEVGMMRGKIERNMDANVVIASVFTATRDNRLETLLEMKWDYIIVDEAHRIMSESYAKPIREIREINEECKLLGLTATPYRLDKKALSTQFDTLVCSDDIATLIKNGYLADYKTFATPVKNLDDEVETTNSGRDYKGAMLSSYMRGQDQIDYLVESYKKYGENRQMIVYCVDRAHARAVEEAYKKAGYKSVGYIDGNTKEAARDKMIADFEKGKLQIIVSIDTLTEGVDLPETGCIQLARPTLSLSLYLQMVGRGLRPKKDGSYLIVLDNAGCSNRFGLVSSAKRWSLDPNVDPNKPREGNKVVAVRPDGTYETNLDDAEFLELEEMTHEEFVEKVINNEEAAENHNNEIEEKIIEASLHFCRTLVEACDLKKEWEVVRKDNQRKGEVVINYKKDTQYRITVMLDYEEATVHFKDNLSDWNMDRYSYKLIAITKTTLGLFYAKMAADKDMQKQFKATVAAVILLQLSTIDLSEIREKARKAKKDALIHNIENHLKKSKIIEMKEREKYPKFCRLNNYFTSLGYWRGSENIAKIVFEKDGLFSKNPIKIYDENGTEVYSSQSTKKDKIIEILEGCDPIFKN